MKKSPKLKTIRVPETGSARGKCPSQKLERLKTKK
jgi:hypothetical protein